MRSLTGRAPRLREAWEDQVGAVLDRRLVAGSDRPLAVGLSGGGDSMALTLMADAWARTHGRPLLILTVDHGLNAASPDWSAACARLAARLEREVKVLRWTGAKPSTGLPAAARAARHGLLADAARQAGARVLMLGHTADDVAESQTMRGEGSTTPDPYAWRPSPAWPQGRGLFVLRPLLGVGRQALRDWLAARGETWIDDPANADLSYARPRARAMAPLLLQPAPEPPVLALAESVSHAPGLITLPRPALRRADPSEAARLLAIAAVCAGGGGRRPASPRIDRASAALQADGVVRLSLAGARLEGDWEQVRIVREAGEAARGGLAAVQLTPRHTTVWDGRFELASEDHAEVRRLAGLASRLPADQRAALRGLPPAARGGLPAIVLNNGVVTCPALTGQARNLVPDRLMAAAGMVDREPP